MNMISQLRQRVREEGKAEITLEEFNQLQAEWITRTKMEKDEREASLVEQPVSRKPTEEQIARYDMHAKWRERWVALALARDRGTILQVKQEYIERRAAIANRAIGRLIDEVRG